MLKTATAYRDILLKEKEAIHSALGIKLNALAKPDRIGEEDQAQISHDEFVSLRLNRIEYLHLRLIKEALDRIESGHYGVCISCEDPIPPKRLQAIPWAKYCLKCQERVGSAPLEQPEQVLSERE